MFENELLTSSHVQALERKQIIDSLRRRAGMAVVEDRTALRCATHSVVDDATLLETSSSRRLPLSSRALLADATGSATHGTVAAAHSESRLAARRNRASRRKQNQLASADDRLATVDDTEQVAGDTSPVDGGGRQNAARFTADRHSAVTAIGDRPAGGVREAPSFGCDCDSFECTCKQSCGCKLLGDDGGQLQRNSTLVSSTLTSGVVPKYPGYMFRCDCKFGVDGASAEFDSMACECGKEVCTCQRKCRCDPPAPKPSDGGVPASADGGAAT